MHKINYTAMDSQEIDNQVLKLKDFQKHNRLTGDEVAAELGISRSLLYKMYTGERTLTAKLKLKIKALIQDFRFDYSVIEENNVNVIRKNTPDTTSPNTPDLGHDTKFHKNVHNNKFTDTENETLIEVQLLLRENYLQTLNEVVDIRVFSTGNTLKFPVDQFDTARYLAFKVYGDSMVSNTFYDLPDRAYVLGKECTPREWPDLKYNDLGYAILTTQNIYIKDIINVNQGAQTITCHSRNPSPEYTDFDLSFNEIKMIFKVVRRIL